MIAGVDGCEGGWIAAIEADNGATLVVHYRAFDDIIANSALQIIVIDIPIGLTAKGPRLCDREARKFIGVRRSSVFPAPLRPMLAARDYRDACAIRMKIENKKCSKQLWAITSKIREVDRHMTPESQKRIYEGHPEVSFALMNNACLIHSKHKPEGRMQRVQLLEKYFFSLKKHLAPSSSLKAEGDIIDAFACLWTARRVVHNTAARFPSDAIYDDRNLRMEIVA